MADQEIKTSIDGLIAYLNENGEANTTAVAAAMSVGEATIIEWANILEKANMIRIVHKSGRMYLSPLRGGVTASTNEELKQSEQTEQMHLEAEVAGQIAVINQISAKIEQFNRSVSSIDDLFKTKYKNIKPVLDKVNSVQIKIDDFEKRMATKTKQIQDLSDKMEKEFDALEKYSAGLSSFSIDTNNARTVSDDIKSRLKAYDANISEMTKQLDEIVYKHRKQAAEISKVVKEKGDQMKEIVNLEDRQIKEYERTAREYKRESETIIRQAQQKRKLAMDEVAKTNQDVKRLSETAEKDLVNLKSSVQDLKTGLGGIAGLNDSLLSIKNDLSDITTQKNTLLKELTVIMQDIKAAGSMKSPAEKQAKAENIKGKASEIAGKISSLKESTEKMKKDFAGLGGGPDKDKGEKPGETKEK